MLLNIDDPPLASFKNIFISQQANFVAFKADLLNDAIELFVSLISAL